MGRIYAFLTATRVEFHGESGDDYTEEHGWVDPGNLTELHESRNYVGPMADWDESDPTDKGAYEDLADAVREAFRAFEGYAESNGNGTFYDSQSYDPFDEAGSYSYAVHFSRKHNDPVRGWVEDEWDPTTDGGVDLRALKITR